MVNINCTSNCIYQQDGKCTLNNLNKPCQNTNNLNLESKCIYFENSSKNT